MQIEENINMDELINLIKFKVDLGIDCFTDEIDLKNNLREQNFKNIHELENFLFEYFENNNLNFVRSEGNTNAKILLIGNKLSDAEIMEKRPYGGKNKILLEKMLNSINVNINDVFLLNIDNFVHSRFDFFDVLFKYLNFLEPLFIINMSSREIVKFLSLHMTNSIFSINVPDPSLLIQEPTLKRIAWDNLKLLKSKLIIPDNK